MKAYLAGGCFWCIAAPFFNKEGILKVVSGYSGGDEKNPTYEQVKCQETGHRETIEIEYDETLISYSKILDVFFDNVDPFDDGGQFIDRGHSYTTAIYYNTTNERDIAIAKINDIEKTTGRVVVVSIEPSKAFYMAEEYHQEFSIKHKDLFEQELVESGRKKL